jgi:UDP-glucose:(heptosyl)LPS alpha-1,3-glucosyltransferase
MADGREGYILTAADAQGELIAALDHMAVDESRRAMSAQATRFGRSHTFDGHVARLTAIFEEVATCKMRRSPHSRKRGSKSNPFTSSAPRSHAVESSCRSKG